MIMVIIIFTRQPTPTIVINFQIDVCSIVRNINVTADQRMLSSGDDVIYTT